VPQTDTFMSRCKTIWLVNGLARRTSARAHGASATAQKNKNAAKCLMEIGLFIEWLPGLCHFSCAKAIKTAQMYFGFNKSARATADQTPNHWRMTW
jgi:hypothetical protein